MQISIQNVNLTKENFGDFLKVFKELPFESFFLSKGTRPLLLKFQPWLRKDMGISFEALKGALISMEKKLTRFITETST